MPIKRLPPYLSTLHFQSGLIETYIRIILLSQVWAGNNQCDYYEWDDCKLVTKLVKFEEPYISCKEEGVIPFPKLENVTKWTNLENETCEIVNCVQCVPKIENICKEINVTKTYQVINETCAMVENMVPNQDFEHIERCFFKPNTIGGMYLTLLGSGSEWQKNRRNV